MSREINIKIETLASGQLKPYADSKYEYELEIKGMSEFDVKQFCTKVLEPCKQTRQEWNEDDASSYFAGYYKFEQVEKISYSEGKYKYFVLLPYTG